MCKYCNTKFMFTELDVGEGIESETSRSTFAHVSKDPETGKYYFDVESMYGARFEIKCCPMCGSELK